MRLACARWLLCLVSMASCESTASLPAVRFTVGPVPVGAVTLAATLNLAGRVVTPDFSYDLALAAGKTQVSFGLFLPEGAAGPLTLYLRALDAAGCVRGQGLTAAGLAGVTQLDLQVPLEQNPAGGCVGGAPQLDAVTPALVPTEGQVPLTITGAGFLPGVTVQIDGKPVAVKARTATTIQVLAPANQGRIGPVPVVVHNPDGGSGTRRDLLGYYVTSLRFDYRSYGLRTPGNLSINPYNVLLSDLNGDGLLDVLMAGSTANSLGVLLNQGRGVFLDGGEALYNVNQAVRVFVADLLGTGQKDVLVGNGDRMDLLRAGADGALTLRKSYPSYYAGPVGDIDGDGKLDVLAFDLTAFDGNSSYMALLRGTGDANEPLRVQPRPAAFPINGFVYFARLLDMNRDGRLDLVTVTNNSAAVLLNNGDGTFASASYFIHPATTRAIGVADVNGDGWPDIATVAEGQDTVSLELNQKNDPMMTTKWKGMGGTLTYKFPGRALYSPLLLDLNGDQQPDLVVGDSAGFLLVLLNRGDGTFPQQGEAGRFHVPLDAGKYAIAAGDLNNDGKQDVVIGDTMNGALTVLLNRSQ